MELDTFSDMTPMEPVLAEAPDSTGGGQGMDTFEDGPVVTEVPEKEEIDKDSQVSQLEDKDEEKEEKKVEEKEEKKEDEEKEEDEETSKEGKESLPSKEEKPQGKQVRLKDGDKAVDISEEATVKVKVKGKNEFVSIAELKKNFSGHQVWDEKIKEADTKLRDSEERSTKFETQKNEIVNDLREVVNKMDDPEGNPLDAMKYLLEITGRPVHTYEKKVLEAQLEQIEELSAMTDTERELYWLNRETEYLRNNQTTRDAKLNDEKTQRELVEQVDGLREQYGVSEEEYIEVQRELSSTDREVTPELVVQAALFKPVHARSQEFVTEQFSEDLGDSDLETLTANMARVLFTNPQATNEEAVKLAARELGYSISTVEEDMEALSSKSTKKHVEVQDDSMLRYGKLEENEIDSFDNYDF